MRYYETGVQRCGHTAQSYLFSKNTTMFMDEEVKTEEVVETTEGGTETVSE